jgi:hypothetical protein
MALALSSVNLVRQRATAFLNAQGASSAARSMFKAFFETMVQSEGGYDMQFVGFADIDTGITTAANAACRVLAVYGKKQSASDTDAWLKIRDNATDTISLPYAEASEEAMFFCPNGTPLATSLKLESHTSSTGTTDSTATHGPMGFVIIGGASIGA